jgi:hypothetical protein
MPKDICPHCGAKVGQYDQKCSTCGKGLSGTALLAPAHQPKPGGTKFFWVMSLLASLLGSAIGIGGSFAMNGAPQQAAIAAIGCLIVIAPYVFARAIDELSR